MKIDTNTAQNTIDNPILGMRSYNTFSTVNSLSGGKTSSYIAANYPADYELFSLIRTSDKNCLFPDKKIRQIVSDKLNVEFIGTLEDDMIIYTMLDLEQFIGKKIIWLTGTTFDELIYTKSGKVNMPSMRQRSCTMKLKVDPIAKYWFQNISEPIEMRIGFRANELSRCENMLSKCDIDGFSSQKFVVGQSINGRNKWQNIAWRKPVFPLVNDGIFKDHIDEYWKNKPVRFAYMNNCIGCFHRTPLLLNLMANKHPEKFQWFIDVEKASEYKNLTWREDVTYEKIKNFYVQRRMFEEDFTECDSGYCGI